MIGAAHLHDHHHLEHAERAVPRDHVEHGAGPAFETAAAPEHDHVVLVARPPQERLIDGPEVSLLEMPAFTLAVVFLTLPPADPTMQWLAARQHGPPPPARAPPFA
jgi:hypothetical protein